MCLPPPVASQCRPALALKSWVRVSWLIHRHHPEREVNSKVPPLVVALVILLTFLAIGVWVWGSGEAKKIGGPAGLRVDPDGHLFIQIQNQLLEHDADGVFLKQHDLGAMGAEIILGSVVFFSDGDILLRLGTDPRSLYDNVRAYQRLTNERSLSPQSPGSGLYRCDLDTAVCQRFGTDGVDFKAAYSVFIDWQTDDVYIADTTRHLLRKYSANGDALAEPVGGFLFPNQLLLDGERLFVVDTNHHQIRIVNKDSGRFGEKIEAVNVVPDLAARTGQTWPTHIARVDNEWWVNNMRTGMNEGGIYIFDNDWRYDRSVTLPPDADPIALVALGDEVLISDWNNDRIYRVARTGQRLDDFSSSGLEQVLAESRKTRLQYTIYSYAGIALFILVLAGIFIRAMAMPKPENDTKSSV